MSCLPCLKEIANGFAATAIDLSHQLATEMLPKLVAEGRLSPENADEAYKMLIGADDDYSCKVRSIFEWVSNLSAPPWPKESSEES